MPVKSFQGRRNAPKKEGLKPSLVSDYMTTKLITFKPDQPVAEVMEVLINNKISGGPVVNDKNELLGIISEGDCIKHISESRYYNMPISTDNVEKHMVKNVETINGDLDIFEAAKQFLHSKRRRFPIVENGKLVGQISQKDILIAALEQKGNNWK
ncbi:MAG TPA: CBS domain-containing protein [Flavobacteriia bacterium]|jgi:CBS domain-containing protein|nr:CBS domain-containing protein [Flavobacteriia bacterium]